MHSVSVRRSQYARMAVAVHIVLRSPYALYDVRRTPTFISKRLLVLEIMGSAIKAYIHFKK